MQILQIRIELLDWRPESQPGIWRRIEIEAGCSFWDLHVAIQNAMGWTDSHLHMFRFEDPERPPRFLGLTHDDELGMEPGWQHKVMDLLSIQSPRVVYEYDLGDSWEHEVVLEDVLPGDGERDSYPRCVGGARACPPEDVGGVSGYENFLQAIADPEHEEHESLLKWVGGGFDPERFEAASVRFDDPHERWSLVYKPVDEPPETPPETPEAPRRAPLQLEGGFSPPEIQCLLLSPFAEDSPLQLVTDLPDEVFAQAPLVRDERRFLQVLAEAAPLKLTQTGNLPRAMIAKLIEAEALGQVWWSKERPSKGNEADLPRATLLRIMAEFTGLTRKRHGKLVVTKRGRSVIDGKLPMGKLFRMLLEQHVTKYNWAFEDPMPESRWLQSLFWYPLYLLQQHGDEPRSSTFYSERFMQGFPFAAQDFSGRLYGTPTELLSRAFEIRALRRFAEEFGLALTSTDEGLSTEPCQVWAGPLLHQVVTWRRGNKADVLEEEDDTGTLLAGPWPQVADAEDAVEEDAVEEDAVEEDEVEKDVADPTIAATLAAFLTAQRRRLRGPQTIRKYERVVALLQQHMNVECPQTLADDELAVYERYTGPGPTPRTFCEIFGPEWIPFSLEGFFGYFMVRKVAGSAQLSRAAGTVCKKLLAWLEAEGVLLEAAGGQEPEDPVVSGREVAQAQAAADLLAVAAHRYADKVAALPEEDYVEFDHYTIAKVEPGKLWLEVYDDDSGKPVVRGPMPASREATGRLRAGWDISCALGRFKGKWQLVEVANVYPV